MHAPVLVTPPASAPVTLPEAKLHLRIEGDDEDTLITALIDAAVAHIDGWSGILGRAIVEQTWRQDFDGFGCPMRLPLHPVIDIVSITARNDQGQITTIADSNYLLRTDAQGDYVHWDADYSYSDTLHDSAAVSVTFNAGYETVPAAIKAAILLMVGNWYRYRSADVETGVATLPMGATALLAPYRRLNV